MSLVELARYPTHVEADVARMTLEANGIDAVIFDAEANNFFGGGGLIWVRLMVLDEEVADARAVLAGSGPA